ncbi:hypothetical protein [uncultured Pedobacter sp.]|uniref:hypothetical protein n=1 Tax=uncultured Pedobacter sp. TaxID=246139 RepID=UPI0025DD2CBF|nr:hypothetical protein [uncultured Pedobacter sp.]
MKKIDLSFLEDGQAGLSPRMGGFLAEAASVCFDHNSHPKTLLLSSSGHFEEIYEVTCTDLHEHSRSSFADIQEATEYGACGVAISIVKTETPFITKRSYKGTGFDYWLGVTTEGFPFQESSRLEVSGIIGGTTSQAATRLSEKLEQMKISDHKRLPGIAIIVEFSKPLTKTGTR